MTFYARKLVLLDTKTSAIILDTPASAESVIIVDIKNKNTFLSKYIK